MAGGTFGGGSGTELDPYLVEDALDLDAVRNGLTAHYKQTADIDLTSWGNWVCIGEINYWTPGGRFTGSYDGGNKKIINMTSEYGLFRFLENATIKNLELDSPHLTGGWWHGFICTDGKLSNFFNIKVLSGTATTEGSVAVFASVEGCEIEKISADVFYTPTPWGQDFGGIVAQTTSSGGVISNIVECYARIIIDPNGSPIYDYVGGIASDARDTNIDRCYSEGSIIVDSRYAGGLIGRWRGTISGNISIQNCYSSVDVLKASLPSGSTSHVGGLIGEVIQTFGSNCFMEIKNCYSYGFVSDGTSNIGGLIGRIYDGSSLQYIDIIDSYYNMETSEKSDVGKGIPKTTTEMKNILTYSTWNIAEQSMVTQDEYGWNSNYIWGIGTANDGYPFLWIDGLPPEVINVWVNKASQFHRTEGLPPKIGGQFMKYVSCWVKKGDRFYPV